ncbi:MAG TPA: coproporphyrinogen III oxidase family protein [Deltaproteobacteria bacterium]|nr:coproporphyrinogen III oxidase family protein [Deltaproteobacteria bacterium]HPR54356.1 coproporphyrinogen III oxidase family protein [Deltaproteobacteria bacterium]HXK47005.1 coproporphyrinogen III oxidase family protein [Deltaproteobacteria bacterium]
MLIDEFIARFVRWSSRSCFAFDEGMSVLPPAAPEHSIHLYVHIPFCVQLCPYCSFHRFPFEEHAGRLYFKALRRELEMYAARGFRFSSVYIGGGTPTVMMDELMGTLDRIGELFSPSEISVETNPDRLEGPVLASLARAGVGRVSVGIQSFTDSVLKAIGRFEKYGSGDELARRVSDSMGIIDTLNVDMIYNFPIQDSTMLGHDLETLLRILPDQITFYPLMISQATRSQMEGIMGRVSPAKERRFYDMITDALDTIYEPNSAWCFSRGGSPMIDEYVVGGEEYVGAGSGAFGLVNGAIHANTFSLPEYIGALENGRLPLQHRKAFSVKEMARYSLLMNLFGLRLDVREFRKRFGRSLWTLLGPELLFFSLAGALHFTPRQIQLTRRGRYYWVIMMREFFTGVDNFRDQSREAVGI